MRAREAEWELGTFADTATNEKTLQRAPAPKTPKMAYRRQGLGRQGTMTQLIAAAVKTA